MNTWVWPRSSVPWYLDLPGRRAVMHLEPRVALGGADRRAGRRSRSTAAARLRGVAGSSWPACRHRRRRPRRPGCLRRRTSSGDYERCRDADHRERDQDCARHEPRRAGHRAPAALAQRRGLLSGADDVARVVLVDVELPLEAEVVGVGAQEPLDVRLPGSCSKFSSSSARRYLPRIFVACSISGKSRD